MPSEPILVRASRHTHSPMGSANRWTVNSMLMNTWVSSGSSMLMPLPESAATRTRVIGDGASTSTRTPRIRIHVAAGPATTWMRMRGVLVEDEAPSPITRVLVAADSGNGISMELPLETHVFINMELTVHLFAEPIGEWVCLDARTRIGSEGIGLASSVLYDTRRRIGLGNQSLLVRPR